MKKTKLLTLLASMFLLAGCNSTEPEKEPVEIYEVKVNPTAVEVTVGEGSKNVNYDVFGKGDFSKEVVISSKDESIATVQVATEGKSFAISPVKEGTTEISVKSKADETKAASVSVTVHPEKIIVVTPEVTAVKASSSGMELAVGSTPQSVTITVEGKGDYDKGVEIVSSNPDIVISDKSSLISGESFSISPVSKGNAEIKVTSKGDKTKGVNIPVLVTEGGILPEPVEISVNPISKEIEAGESFDITSSVTGTTENINWSVEGTSGIVSLTNESNTGATVTALAVGEVKVVASVAGKSASTRVTVVEPSFYTGIKFTLDDGEQIEMSKSPKEEGKEYLAQFTYNFSSIDAGTRIDFYGKLSGDYSLITTKLSPSADDTGNKIQNNLKPTTDKGIDWTVLKDATDVKLYFEIYEEGSRFWLQGGPEILTGYYLSINDNLTKLEPTEDFEDYKQYKAENIDIEIDDVIKVFNADSKESFCPTLQKDAGAYEKFSDTTAGQLTALADGNFNFYIKLKFGEDKIFISENLPEIVKYQAKIGDDEPIDLTEVTPTPEGYIKKYQDTLASVTAGTRIDFIAVYEDSSTAVITKNISPNADDVTNKVENNLKPATSEGTDWTVQKNADDVKLYFELTESGYGFWLQGGPELLTGFYLSINGDLTQLVDDGMIADDYHQYKLLEVDLEVNDVIKVYNADAKSYFCPTLESGGASTKFDDSTSGQLSVITAGNYNVYVKLKYGADLIYISENLPEIVKYQAKIGSDDPIDLTEVTPTPEGYIKKYQNTLASVTKDTRIDFIAVYDDSSTAVITKNISPNADDVGNKIQNNLKPATESGTDWTVLKDATDVKLYFEITESGYGFWLQGGPAIPAPTAKLMGLGGDWSTGETMNENAEKVGEYYINQVQIELTDEFKVVYDGNYYGFNNVKDGCIGLVNESAENSNIMVKEAGLYNIFWDSNETGTPTKSIWIEKYVAPVKSITFAVNPIDCNVGDNPAVNVTASNCEGLTYDVSPKTGLSVLSGTDEELLLNATVAGTYEVTATANDGVTTAVLTVNVTEPCAHEYVNHICNKCGEVEDGYAKVTFKVKSNTNVGQDLFLVGDFTSPTWLDGKIEMEYKTGEFPWTTSIVVTENTTIEYKIVMIQGGNVTWMSGGNRTQLVDSSMTISFEYNFN